MHTLVYTMIMNLYHEYKLQSSNNKFMPSTYDNHGRWSALPSNILFIILKDLSLLDCVRFRSVCKHWKTSYSSFTKPKNQVPWLLLQDGTYENITIVSIPEGHPYNITIPNNPKIVPNFNPGIMYCFGAQNGWLVIADSKYNLRAVQPFTGAHIDLPEINTFPFVTYDDWIYSGIYSGEYSWRGTPQRMKCYFAKVALLSPATPSGSTTVMMIHNSRLSFARPGDGAWMVVEESSQFTELIVHCGKFHTMTKSGMVEVWEPEGVSAFRPRCVAPGLPRFDDRVAMAKLESENPRLFKGIVDWVGVFSSSGWKRKYLVESADGEQLMMVVMINNFSGQEGGVCAMFKVLVLDKKNFMWRHLESLGDQAVFVGRNVSVCLRVSSVFADLVPNCIYFENGASGGVFRMEDNFVEPMKLPEVGYFKMPNMWFTMKIE